MHMSHKKRASTAFKSIGAASLAAATIISGVSFGPAAYAASMTPSAAPGLTGPLVVSYQLANQPQYYNGYEAPSRAGQTVRAWLSLSKSDATAKAGEWTFPALDGKGEVKANGTDLCLTSGATSVIVTAQTCDGRASQQFEWKPGSLGANYRALYSSDRHSWLSAQGPGGGPAVGMPQPWPPGMPITTSQSAI
jgi:hypothetical protein